MSSKIYIKRTSVSGRTPNTSNLSTGELALNMTDGIMYSSNGSNIFEIGANVTSLSIMGLKRFTKTQPFNPKAARQIIAQKLIEDGRYKF